MAHYALLDENNTVLNVIVGRDELDTEGLPEGFSDWEEYYLSRYEEATSVKRTSYNTQYYKHYDENGNLTDTQEKAFRGCFAVKGGSYDPVNDVFVPLRSEWFEEEGKYLQPKIAPSYVLNEHNKWEAPIPVPDNENAYTWNEEAYQADNTQGWELA